MSTPNHEHTVLDFFRTAFNSGDIELSDSVLMDRYVDFGDRLALELLVRRHVSLVHRVCRSILRSHHDAEDAAQAVFMILARKAAKIRDRAAVVGWLAQTARRVALDAVRIRKRRIENLDSIELPNMKGERDGEAETILHEAIARLSEKHRLPILLCFFEGLSHAEAAQRLGWPLGTLNTRLERAKELLLREGTRRGLTIPAAGIAALLSANHLPAFGVSEVVSMAEFAFAFGCRQSYLPAGVSPLSLELTRRALRTMFLTKLKFTFGIALLSGVTAVSFANGLGRATEAEPQRSIPQVVEPQAVLAPVPQDTPAIDPKTRAKYEELGAIYGGFVTLPVNPSTNQPTVEPTFLSGEEAAKQGLPGFCWDKVPKGKFTNLPQVDCEFGLQFPHAAAATLSTMIRGLKDLKSLRMLILPVFQERDASIKELTSLKDLRSLHLQSDFFSKGDTKQLASLKSLRTLTLWGNMPDSAVKELLPLENLHALNLGSMTLTDAGVKEMVGFKNLESVTLSSPKLTEDALESLARLKRLRCLSLWDCETGAGIKHLAALENLQVLFLGRQVTDDEAKELARLKNLQWLRLHSFKLTDEGVKHLSSLKKLKSLTLLSNNLTDAGVKDIASLENLEELDLFAMKLTDDGITELASLKHLESLHLNAQEIVEPKELAAMKNLRSLQLWSQKLNEKTLKKIASLENLRELQLSSPFLNDEVIQELTALKKLQSLKLISDRIDDDCMQDVAKLKDLHTLFLKGTLTDESIKDLAPLTKIQSLTLWSSHLTDDCIPDLVALKSLRSLDFLKPQFSDKGKKELQDRLPNCNISIH